MNRFAVMIHEPNEEVLERLREEYEAENVYRLAGNTFLVRTKRLAEDVSVAAGIKGDNRLDPGVVFKLNDSYAGFTARALWDWLDQ